MFEGGEKMESPEEGQIDKEEKETIEKNQKDRRKQGNCPRS